MNIEKLRRKIDGIDFEIIRLLEERMETAVRLRRFKKEIEDKEREKEVMKQITQIPSLLLSKDFLEKHYNLIIKESKELQKKDFKLIGFQGEHGAYSEIAARKIENAIPIPHLEFVDVVDAVESGEVDYGILPIENSLEGSISQVDDLLIERNIYIVGEISLNIKHALLTLPETDYREVKVVYSHPQALAQCKGFIRRNKLEPRPFYDTAGAAKMLAKERLKAAGVIASSLCAKLYGLEVLKENIEDDGGNTTRFIIISKEQSKEKGEKCSIAFSTEHKAGALFRVLKIFAEKNINLTRIASRPHVKTSSYAFLVDFEGNLEEKRVQEALKEVENECKMYKFLGCYKKQK